MVGTVVVPLDGSELSERALTYAAEIADRSGAPLFLLHVARVGADDQEITESRNYLRHVADRFSGRVQIEVRPGDDVRRGRTDETIVSVAEELLDPVIVMSTHGHGGVRRWITGSVADKVVRTAGSPVLLVRADQEIPEQLAMKAILVPLDGSQYSESALPYAAELARLFDCTLHLLRVVDTPSAYAMLSRHAETAVTGDLLDDIIRSMTREATEYIDQVADRLACQGISVKKVVLEGYPGEQLIGYERSGFFQLVVMATAGRSGVSRLVFGSVAERVLKMGRSPVMMIRPFAEDEPEDVSE